MTRDEVENPKKINESVTILKEKPVENCSKNEKNSIFLKLLFGYYFLKINKNFLIFSLIFNLQSNF